MEKMNSRLLKTNNELKVKIEKMKKRHVTALKLASEGPAITVSDSKVK